MMPIFAVLHMALALYFSIHAVRSGQSLYWIGILFGFPFIGSAVYFFAVYVSAFKMERGARKVAQKALQFVDPSRDLRMAQDEFEATPTAQNQMRLAYALLDAGKNEEAVAAFETCMKTAFFSEDLDVRLGAVRAYIACNRPEQALAQIEAIRRQNSQFREETVAILEARALSLAGRQAEARAAFEEALSRFGSFEVRVEFTIWAIQTGDGALAGRLQAEIDRTMSRWTKATRVLNQPLLQRLKAAYAQAEKPGRSAP